MESNVQLFDSDLIIVMHFSLHAVTVTVSVNCLTMAHARYRLRAYFCSGIFCEILSTHAIAIVIFVRLSVRHTDDPRLNGSVGLYINIFYGTR